MNIDLKHLKSFLMLSEELHFGKAAQRLFIAQPPLSRQIKELEAQLGAQLFIRNSRNVRLTAAGAYFQRECYQLFTTLESVQITVKKIAEGLSGPLRIGYVGSAMQNVLPEVIKKTNQHLPTLYIQMYELTTAEQVEALSGKRIDIGFLRPPVVAEDLAVRKIYQEGFSLVVPLNHLVAKNGLTNLRQVAKEPFVLFSKSKGRGLYDKVLRICHAAGFTPKAMHEANQMNSIVRLVEAGLGISIVPASVAHGHNLKVKFIPLENNSERTEVAMAYQITEERPIVTQFLKILTTSVKEI